jgi:short-subunit dehydrogenase
VIANVGPKRQRTALITGASGGIGEELAGIFAARRFDLVLVARDAARLRAVGEALTGRYGVRYTALPADLSVNGAVAELVGELEHRGLVIDVLVNNAGFATYGQFKDLDLGDEMRMIQVNIAALAELTRRLLPGMVERRWGRILNVASTAAFMPGPLMAVYYASKAFVLSFSEAIGEELRGTGVTATALCPGPTRTGFQSRAGMEESKLVRGRTIMDAATVAREGYAGLMRGQAVVIPGLKNRLQILAPKFLPRRLIPGIVRSAQERVH